MNENDKTNLIDQTKFRLSKISKIENYFNQEINQRKSYTKKLSKYVAAFDYIDKIALLVTSGGGCIIFSVSVVGAPIGVAGASFALSL